MLTISIVHSLNAHEFFVTNYTTIATSIPNWLVFSFILYFIGLLGIIFNYKNFLVTMISVEVIYLGAITSFVLYGVLSRDPQGSIYGLVLLILAACESAVGLGILIVLYRFGRTIDFASYQQLGG